MNKDKKIIELLLKEGNILNKQLLSKILEIDSDFDLNRFDISKTKFEAMFFTLNFEEKLKLWTKKDNIDTSILDQSNSSQSSIRFPFLFKRKNDIELQSDMNIFFRDIENVVYIEEPKRDTYVWKNNKYIKAHKRVFFHVKYQTETKNKRLKTFRFLLHSVSKKATNNLGYDYFIDGVEINNDEFKKFSRKAKMNNLLEE